MYFDNPVNLASAKIDKSIRNLRSGLEPEVLLYWYRQIQYESMEKVGNESKDKIHFEQHQILWMRFKINYFNPCNSYSFRNYRNFYSINGIFY
ncbi:MAG TPA: hypothetical protein VIZ62_11870 [Nitrososphaeraceae archaeon]